MKAGKLEETGRTVDGLREQLPRRARRRRSCLPDLVPEADWFFVIACAMGGYQREEQTPAAPPAGVPRMFLRDQIVHAAILRYSRKPWRRDRGKYQEAFGKNGTRFQLSSEQA